MNDASEKYAQQIETARLVLGRGDRSGAAEALRAAIETTRREPALHREHAAALVRLGILEQELGRPADAERSLTEAVSAGERNLGAEHPSLASALNELSRLHIRQSDYSRAEQVLKRLLFIARAKGDSHPDVATALAGLAVAKRGLGENVAAEVLYRHALRIREDVLAPDHMAIVVTLEQLSETCATRGNLVEALVHLKRALPKREGALGVDHATVRSVRDRIADLERRISRSGTRVASRPSPTPAAEVTPVAPAPATLVATATPSASTTARATVGRLATPPRAQTPAPITAKPKRASDLVFLYEPEPVASRAALQTRERVPTPARSVAVASALSDAAELSARVQSTSLARASSTSPSAALAHTAALAIGPVAAIADAPVSVVPSRDIADLLSSIKRTVGYASAGAVVVVLAIAGSDFSASGQVESEHAPSAVSAESRVAVVPPTSAATPPATSAVLASAVTPDASRPAPTATAPQPARVSDAPAPTPSALVAVPSLRKLVVPRVAMPSLDSLMRTTANVGRDTAGEPITTGGSLLASAPSEDANVTRPVLVFAPALRFPDELRSQRLEGEVVVQFRVNEKGRVEASTMKVLQSEHELFSAAVRSVLPRFRFEPARSAAGAKPQAAWVQFRAQFTARN